MFILLAVFSLCFPILSFFLSLLYYFEKRRAFCASLLIGLAYASMFYNYIPDSGNDSIRHMALLANYRNIPIWECFDAGRYTQLYIWDLWNWIIAQFDLPYLLPASGAFIGYTIVAYLVFDYCKMISASSRATISALILILAATNPIGYAVGIRSSCAYAICVLGIYLGEIHNAGKIKVFILMAAAILIHHSAALIFLVWLIIPFYKKKPLAMAIAIGCSVLMLSTIINIISPLLSSSGGISKLVLEMFGTINAYQEESEYNIVNSTSFKAMVELLCSVSYILAAIIRSYDVLPAFTSVRQKQKNSLKTKTHHLKDITILYTIVGLAMMQVLVVNGKRYLAVPEVLLGVLMAYSFERRPLGVIQRINVKQLLCEIVMVGTAALHLMLNIYSLAWGDASIGSLAGGALGGAIYAMVA